MGLPNHIISLCILHDRLKLKSSLLSIMGTYWRSVIILRGLVYPKEFISPSCLSVFATIGSIIKLMSCFRKNIQFFPFYDPSNLLKPIMQQIQSVLSLHPNLVWKQEVRSSNVVVVVLCLVSGVDRPKTGESVIKDVVFLLRGWRRSQNPYVLPTGSC